MGFRKSGGHGVFLYLGPINMVLMEMKLLVVMLLQLN
jgi:hypothetical protein